MDSLTQLGLGGGILALLWWFLKTVVQGIQPVIVKHIETMDAFQENQAAIAGSLSLQKTTDEEHRARVDADHREILSAIKERPPPPPRTPTVTER